MNLNLKDKIVFVSGSSKGLGFYIAKNFLIEGAFVIINGRHKNSIKLALQKLSPKYKNKVKGIQGDLTLEADTIKVCNFLKKNYGYIDILITNIGSGVSAKIGDENLKDWRESISINLYSAVNIIKGCTGLLKKSPHKDRSIVCISSICGHESLGAPLAYSSSKAALNSYVKASSKFLADFNIRINAVSPGNLLFPGSSWEKKMLKNQDQIFDYINNNVALKKFGNPEEIASAVCFLSSDRSSFTTGSILVVDGGQVKS